MPTPERQPDPQEDEFRLNPDDSVTFGTRSRGRTAIQDERMNLAVQWARMTAKKAKEMEGR